MRSPSVEFVSSLFAGVRKMKKPLLLRIGTWDGNNYLKRKIKGQKMVMFFVELSAEEIDWHKKGRIIMR
ncbi:hypothetical protein JCM39068_20260 [Desulfocastanea catecholica]